MAHTWRLITALIVILVLTGCGGDDSDDENEQPAQNATEILNLAHEQILTTDSMSFTLEVQGTTWIDSGQSIQLLSARGDISRPDLVDVQFQVRLLGSTTASIRMISAGDESWTTDLVSGNWGPAPEEFGYDPSTLLNAESGLSSVMAQIADPTITGTEDVSGQSAWKLEGTVANDLLTGMTGGNFHGETHQIIIWISEDTYDLLRIQIAEPGDAGLEDPATWIMELRNHNEPVTIEPPV